MVLSIRTRVSMLFRYHLISLHTSISSLRSYTLFISMEMGTTTHNKEVPPSTFSFHPHRLLKQPKCLKSPSPTVSPSSSLLTLHQRAAAVPQMPSNLDLASPPSQRQRASFLFLFLFKFKELPSPAQLATERLAWPIKGLCLTSLRRTLMMTLETMMRNRSPSIATCRSG